MLLAALIDLDGVLLDSNGSHSEAWHQLFKILGPTLPSGFVVDLDSARPESDFLQYLNGRPAWRGIGRLFAVKGIALPRGESTDAMSMHTQHGMANLKRHIWLELVKSHPPAPFPDAIDFLDWLNERNWAMAVVSSSRGARQLLSSALSGYSFADVVDGADLAASGLQGKPHPDSFLTAARRLAVAVEHCVVLDDSPAGVTAGRAANAGLVVGVARRGEERELLEHGAHICVTNLRDAIQLIMSHGTE